MVLVLQRNISPEENIRNLSGKGYAISDCES